MKTKTETKLYETEGQMGGAVGAVIGLISGIGVSVLVLIFVGSLGGQTYELVEDDLVTIGNTFVSADAFTALNGTAVSLDFSTVQNGTLNILNSTNAVGLGNFSIDYTAGTVELLNNAFNNTALTANYTYGTIEIQESINSGIISGFEALEQTGTYLPVIVLAVVISLVLALVLGMTGQIGGNKGGAAL